MSTEKTYQHGVIDALAWAEAELKKQRINGPWSLHAAEKKMRAKKEQFQKGEESNGFQHFVSVSRINEQRN